MKETNKIAIMTTVSSEDVALQIAQELLGNKLAVCINILPKVHSIYIWKGEIVDDHESMLVIKSRSDKFDEIEQVIKAISCYEVPEVLAFKIDNGANEFSEWIDENLSEPDNQR